MMKAALIAAVALAACQAAEPAPPPLTPDGWGPLRIGMAEDEAIRAAGLVPPDAGPPLEHHFECHELLLPSQPGMYVMIQEGRISRITLTGEGPLRTDRGFGVGDREADILRAYGSSIVVTPHHYEGEPAHYLTWWAVPDKRGVRYETEYDGVVNTIHAGDDSIRLVEGCA